MIVRSGLMRGCLWIFRVAGVWADPVASHGRFYRGPVDGRLTGWRGRRRQRMSGLSAIMGIRFYLRVICRPGSFAIPDCLVSRRERCRILFAAYLQTGRLLGLNSQPRWQWQCLFSRDLLAERSGYAPNSICTAVWARFEGGEAIILPDCAFRASAGLFADF